MLRAVGSTGNSGGGKVRSPSGRGAGNGRGNGIIGQNYLSYLLSLSPARSYNLGNQSSRLFYDDVSASYPTYSVGATGFKAASVNAAGTDITSHITFTTTGGPLPSRGFVTISATYPASGTNGTSAPLLWADLNASTGRPRDGGALCFAFYPVAGTPSCQLASFNSYFAFANTDFPFAITYDSAARKVGATVSYGGDFVSDVNVTGASALTLSAWNYIIVKWDSIANGGVITIWTNGDAGATGVRASAFSIGTNRDVGIGGPAYQNGGGVNTNYALGASFTEMAYFSTNFANINSTTAATLYTKFTT